MNEIKATATENALSKPKKKFLKFILLILVGFAIGFYFTRKGYQLTPESFKAFVLSLGLLGPIIFIGIFIIRPLFLIPSIVLFVGGGLAFGPVLGPIYASFGAALGGVVGFWFSRLMGREYVNKKLKLGAHMIDNTRFSFSVVFLLSLLPIMPVTVINYGAGLSGMKFNNYIAAHILGITPRAFAYGFFGSTLLEIGSRKFMASLLILVVMGIVTAYIRLRSKQKQPPPLAEETSPSG
ncbi:MAG: TVP38/TMEM64 family protein [Nitrospina sp.]|nr:MAG: TVP38/TMEM64 family protein [Nitrospina sp.]